MRFGAVVKKQANQKHAPEPDPDQSWRWHWLALALVLVLRLACQKKLANPGGCPILAALSCLVLSSNGALEAEGKLDSVPLTNITFIRLED